MYRIDCRDCIFSSVIVPKTINCNLAKTDKLTVEVDDIVDLTLSMPSHFVRKSS